MGQLNNQSEHTGKASQFRHSPLEASNLTATLRNSDGFWAHAQNHWLSVGIL